MSHSLNIDRVIAEWKVPRDQSLNSLSIESLNCIALGQLQRALAASLEQLCPEQDESIWLIRHLNVSLGVDLSWNNDELADRWAYSLTVGLLKTIESGGDNQSVFHYRSRAEYLAAFMTDVASGSAWNKWQYASLSGLAALSSSAVLRTLLLTETSGALAALAMLTPSMLRRVVSTLLSHDAAQCSKRLTDCSVTLADGLLSRTLDIWESEREKFPASGCAERDFLGLLGSVLSQEKNPDNTWQQPAMAAAAVILVEQLFKNAERGMAANPSKAARRKK